MVTAALAPLVLLAIVAVLWVDSITPRWVYWEAGLIFLIALEAAYGVALAAAPIGTVALGVLAARSRRRGRPRPGVARGLLLCGSVWFGLAAAEAAAVLWEMRPRRGTPAPWAEADRKRLEGFSRGLPAATTKVVAPTEFPDPRDDREIDILVVGESSAEGVPYNNWLSIGRLVAWQLGEILPDRPIRLQVLAMSGETLELQQGRLEGLKRRPDLMIVYCGHNEFSSRFFHAREPHYYFDEEAPTAWGLLVGQMEGTSPLCGLIRRTADRCRVAIPPPPDGHRALVDVPVYTAAEYTALLMDFRRRLEAIVAYGERVGARPVLIAPPGNDAGFEPNRSFLSPATPRAERDAFARDFLAARRAEGLDPEKARAAYRGLLARQPGFAEAHYRLARLLERAGAWEDAYSHDVAARDGDGYPMRCPSAFQDVYRDVAARHGCILVDGQALFHAVGRHGLLDEDLFHDGMHPSLRGQIALAQGVLHELRARGAFGWPKDSPEPVIDPARCVEHFGLRPDVWRYICLWGIMFYDKTWPIRYDPSHRLEMKHVFARAADRIEAGEPPEAVGLANIGTPEPVPVVGSHREGGTTDDPPRGPIASRKDR